MTQQHDTNEENNKRHMPDPEEVANELANAKTIEQMLEGELTEELGYDRY